MGGAVSSGRDNNELIDNLIGGNYIRSRSVERVFRVLDRADYLTPESRDQAYKDLAWRNGSLHMSAPCIYSEVMEGLDLRPGLSFLNIGSGTGYLSTLVGLILGSTGVSHGVEVHPMVVEYANKKLSQFIENSPTLDEFDFCEPKFYCGNGLCLAPLQAAYDRVYCGAGCPEEYENYFKQLIKVGGVLVMPLNDNLVQVRRSGRAEWRARTLLNVSFATLRVPAAATPDIPATPAHLLKLEELKPARLQALCRACIRSRVRAALLGRHAALRAEPRGERRAEPRAAPASGPRRICIPIEDDSDVEGLNALHDLDRAGGANEMNALLSLVLSMGQNRVAGALRFDSLDSPTSSEEDEEEADDEHGDAGDEGAEPAGSPADDAPRPCRGVLTFEFQDTVQDDASGTATSQTPENNQNKTESLEIESKVTKSESENRQIDPTTSNTKSTDSRTHSQTESVNTKTDPEDSKTKSDIHEQSFRDTPTVPTEVEICLGSKRDAKASRSTLMDWEETVEAKTQSSDDETTENSKELKRQKLDSGIGEENTPSSDSPTDKTESKSEDSDVEEGPSDSLTDDVDDEIRGGRRRQKRRRHVRSRSSSSSSGAASGSDTSRSESERVPRRRSRPAAPAAPPPPAAPAPPAPPAAPAAPAAPDARRLRLARLMRSAIHDLPLPLALRRYLNYGRCFQL